MDIQTLPPRKTLNGKFDAYCRLCWEPVYCLWIDDADPEGKCQFGHERWEDCEDAQASFHNKAMLHKFRRECVADSLDQFFAALRSRSHKET